VVIHRSRDRVLIASIGETFFISFLIICLSFTKETILSMKSPWEYVFLIVILVIAVVFFLWVLLCEFNRPLLPKQTQTERQELESWLASEGYRKFWGTISRKDGVITFRLDKCRDPYPENGIKPMEHGNYVYWDFGQYRIVRRLDLSIDSEAYVK